MANEQKVGKECTPTAALLSDAQLLQWLHNNLEWDGHGYWLPEICIRELDVGQRTCSKPTMNEFRAALSSRAMAA